MNDAPSIPIIAAYIRTHAPLRGHLADEAGSAGDLEHAEALQAGDPSAALLAAEGIFEMAHEGHARALQWAQGAAQ